MKALIETSIETKDGIADCRMELHAEDDALYYDVTLLYPNMVNGYSRSEIYNHNIYCCDDGCYRFSPTDENIHPKIKKLENLLSRVLVNG